MSKTQKILSLLVLLVLVVTIPLFLRELIGGRGLVAAKTYTWTGNGQDPNWSNRDNWNPKGVPGAGSEVIFNAGSAKESVIDSEVEVGEITIDGFGGKITQYGKLSVAGDFYQRSGEFLGGTEMAVAGNFTQIAPGIFSTPLHLDVEGSLQVDQNNFKVTEASVITYREKDKKLLYCVGECEKNYLPVASLDETGKVVANVWGLNNLSNGLVAKVSATEWTITDLSGEWQWAYVFEGIEREGQNVFQANGGNVTTKDNGVYIDRGQGVTEYYLNGQDGIEQTFVLNEPKGAVGAMAVVGKLRLENATPKMSGESTLSLYDRDNQPVFNFAHLKIFDANRQEVAGTMSVEERGAGEYKLSIKLNDTGAKYPLTVDPVGGTPEWISNATDNYWYGKFVAGLGKGAKDDPYGDVAVSEYNNEGGNVYLYKGNANISTMKKYHTADWSARSYNNLGHFGRDLAGNGDVNGDGYNDLGIGDLAYPNGQKIDSNQQGRAYVYYAGATGMKRGSGQNAPATSSAEVTVFAPPSNAANYAWFGEAMAIDGDVNGDGLSDVLIGAPGTDYARARGVRGRAYLKLGTAAALSGVVSNYDWTASGTIAGTAGDQFGYAVTFVNANNDRFSDVAVGSSYYKNSTENNGVGRVDIYRGSATSPYLTHMTTLHPPANSTTIRFGWSVANAGDVNGDGYDDLAVGAHYYNGKRGAVFLFWGSADGYSSTRYWLYEGDVMYRFLGYSVAGLGDVNGDGVDDFIVGGYAVNIANTSAGKNFVIYGKKAPVSGWSPTGVWSYSNNKNQQYLGYKVAYIGDVNGAGANEVAFGGYGSSSALGVAYIFAGQPLKVVDNKVDSVQVGVSTDLPKQDNWFDTGAPNKENDGLVEFYSVCNGTRGVKNKMELCGTQNHGRDFYESIIKYDDVELNTAATNFKINASAADSSGVASIKIERIYSSDGTLPSNWGGAKSTTCTIAVGAPAACEVCIQGGNCANKQITPSELAVNPAGPDAALYFRVTVRDKNSPTANSVTTGWNTTYDKFYKVTIKAPTISAECANHKFRSSVVNLPSDWCVARPLADVVWDYAGSGAAFKVEVGTASYNVPAGQRTYMLDLTSMMKATPGNHSLKITASKPECGADVSISKSFGLPAIYPAVRIETSCASGGCNFTEPITFNGSASSVSVGPAKYEWTINGDPVGSQPTLTHTFNDPAGGKIEYALKVTDGFGQSCTKQGSFAVSPGIPRWIEVTPR